MLQLGEPCSAALPFFLYIFFFLSPLPRFFDCFFRSNQRDEKRERELQIKCYVTVRYIQRLLISKSWCSSFHKGERNSALFFNLFVFFFFSFWVWFFVFIPLPLPLLLLSWLVYIKSKFLFLFFIFHFWFPRPLSVLYLIPNCEGIFLSGYLSLTLGILKMVSRVLRFMLSWWTSFYFFFFSLSFLMVFLDISCFYCYHCFSTNLSFF